MYEKLTTKTEENIKTIKTGLAFCDENAIRRIDNPHDDADTIRSNFIKDINKIMNCPYFTRYSDKTQVFSFYKNDDITHRLTHVLLVSRIARTIGKALGLNTELIEAIALGHDIGHTPFGHTGEYVLDKIFYAKTKKHFYHHLQSVRVLDKIFPLNLSLQTLDGILCHNGEAEMEKYVPHTLSNFSEFDNNVNLCYSTEHFSGTLIPSTLEGCVVRISDIIAYLGKDRQDAIKINAVSSSDFSDSIIGNFNAEIINNLTVNIIENSFNKNYIALDSAHFNALKKAKSENIEKIYLGKKSKEQSDIILPMMQELYDKLLLDLETEDKNSPIYTQHIDYINSQFYKRNVPYEQTDKNQIVVDFIASMTDDYFIEIYKHTFKNSKIMVKYKEYFD